MLNKPLCPRVAELYVPLVNFFRAPVPESLVMRVRSGRPIPVPPSPKPNIGILVRPQHVQKHKKVKDIVKEKPVLTTGHYSLRKVEGVTLEQAIQITNDTKDDSFLRQIILSLGNAQILSRSFKDPDRQHREILTNQESVRLAFDELDRRHLPLLFDSLHRALYDMVGLSTKEQIHCIHLGWQALSSIDNALEIGRPLATTLVDILTRNMAIYFDGFTVFLSKYEMVCAKPVIRIIQELLVYDWSGEVIVTGIKARCLILLDALYPHFSHLLPLFQNNTIGRAVISERHQRAFAEFNGNLLRSYLLRHSYKLALFEFWVVQNMERQHKRGWGFRKLARHFINLGFRFDVAPTAYLGISAERQDLLHSVTRAITQQPTSHLHKPMKVKYAGEQGIDLAGLTADLLARVIKSAVARCLEMNLLREQNGLWFREGAGYPGEFQRLGMLIGLAMYNGVKSLPLDFPPMFYKKLVGDELQLEDMITFDPELYHGWQQLLNEHVEGFTFEYTYKSTGQEIRTHVLEHDGDEPRVVTENNRAQYIRMMFDAITDELIAPSFLAIQAGIESIVPRTVLRLFTAAELQNLLSGDRIIDVARTVDQLKQVTVYDGFSPDDQVIKNLWAVLRSGTPEKLGQFLDLITATDRLPASFPANFKLTIFKSGSDEEMYPLHRVMLT
jgi:hypothetical protein